MANEVSTTSKGKTTFNIPKVKTATYRDNLQLVSKDNRDVKIFLEEINKNCLDVNFNKEYKPVAVYMVHSTTLQSRYIEKRLEMKDAGRNSQSLSDQYGFLVSTSVAQKHKIAKEGLCTASQRNTTLGKAEFGIYLTRYFDVAVKHAWKTGHEKLEVFVFKYFTGKCKFLNIDIHKSNSDIDPTPNYDSHVGSRPPNLSDSLYAQVARSNIYLYEYTDECVPSKNPRHCLPFAVIRLERIKQPEEPIKRVIVPRDIPATSVLQTKVIEQPPSLLADSSRTKVNAAPSIQTAALTSSVSSSKTLNIQRHPNVGNESKDTSLAVNRQNSSNSVKECQGINAEKNRELPIKVVLNGVITKGKLSTKKVEITGLHENAEDQKVKPSADAKTSSLTVIKNKYLNHVTAASQNLQAEKSSKLLGLVESTLPSSPLFLVSTNNPAKNNVAKRSASVISPEDNYNLKSFSKSNTQDSASGNNHNRHTSHSNASIIHHGHSGALHLKDPVVRAEFSSRGHHVSSNSSNPKLHNINSLASSEVNQNLNEVLAKKIIQLPGHKFDPRLQKRSESNINKIPAADRIERKEHPEGQSKLARPRANHGHIKPINRDSHKGEKKKLSLSDYKKRNSHLSSDSVINNASSLDQQSLDPTLNVLMSRDQNSSHLASQKSTIKDVLMSRDQSSSHLASQKSTIKEISLHKKSEQAIVASDNNQHKNSILVHKMHHGLLKRTFQKTESKADTLKDMVTEAETQVLDSSCTVKDKIASSVCDKLVSGATSVLGTSKFESGAVLQPSLLKKANKEELLSSGIEASDISDTNMESVNNVTVKLLEVGFNSHVVEMCHELTNVTSSHNDCHIISSAENIETEGPHIKSVKESALFESQSNKLQLDTLEQTNSSSVAKLKNRVSTGPKSHFKKQLEQLEQTNTDNVLMYRHHPKRVPISRLKSTFEFESGNNSVQTTHIDAATHILHPHHNEQNEAVCVSNSQMNDLAVLPFLETSSKDLHTVQNLSTSDFATYDKHRMPTQKPQTHRYGDLKIIDIPSWFYKKHRHRYKGVKEKNVPKNACQSSLTRQEVDLYGGKPLPKSVSMRDLGIKCYLLALGDMKYQPDTVVVDILKLKTNFKKECKHCRVAQENLEYHGNILTKPVSATERQISITTSQTSAPEESRLDHVNTSVSDLSLDENSVYTTDSNSDICTQSHENSSIIQQISTNNLNSDAINNLCNATINMDEFSIRKPSMPSCPLAAELEEVELQSTSPSSASSDVLNACTKAVLPVAQGLNSLTEASPDSCSNIHTRKENTVIPEECSPKCSSDEENISCHTMAIEKPVAMSVEGANVSASDHFSDLVLPSKNNITNFIEDKDTDETTYISSVLPSCHGNNLHKDDEDILEETYACHGNNVDEIDEDVLREYLLEETYKKKQVNIINKDKEEKVQEFSLHEASSLKQSLEATVVDGHFQFERANITDKIDCRSVVANKRNLFVTDNNHLSNKVLGVVDSKENSLRKPLPLSRRHSSNETSSLQFKTKKDRRLSLSGFAANSSSEADIFLCNKEEIGQHASSKNHSESDFSSVPNALAKNVFSDISNNSSSQPGTYLTKTDIKPYQVPSYRCPTMSTYDSCPFSSKQELLPEMTKTQTEQTTANTSVAKLYIENTPHLSDLHDPSDNRTLAAVSSVAEKAKMSLTTKGCQQELAQGYQRYFSATTTHDVDPQQIDVIVNQKNVIVNSSDAELRENNAFKVSCSKISTHVNRTKTEALSKQLNRYSTVESLTAPTNNKDVTPKLMSSELNNTHFLMHGSKAFAKETTINEPKESGFLVKVFLDKVKESAEVKKHIEDEFVTFQKEIHCLDTETEHMPTAESSKEVCLKTNTQIANNNKQVIHQSQEKAGNKIEESFKIKPSAASQHSKWKQVKLQKSYQDYSVSDSASYMEQVAAAKPTRTSVETDSFSFTRSTETAPIDDLNAPSVVPQLNVQANCSDSEFVQNAHSAVQFNSFSEIPFQPHLPMITGHGSNHLQQAFGDEFEQNSYNAVHFNSVPEILSQPHLPMMTGHESNHLQQAFGDEFEQNSYNAVQFHSVPEIHCQPHIPMMRGHGSNHLQQAFGNEDYRTNISSSPWDYSPSPQQYFSSNHIISNKNIVTEVPEFQNPSHVSGYPYSIYSQGYQTVPQQPLMDMQMWNIPEQTVGAGNSYRLQTYSDRDYSQLPQPNSVMISATAAINNYESHPENFGMDSYQRSTDLQQNMALEQYPQSGYYCINAQDKQNFCNVVGSNQNSTFWGASNGCDTNNISGLEFTIPGTQLSGIPGLDIQGPCDSEKNGSIELESMSVTETSLPLSEATVSRVINKGQETSTFDPKSIWPEIYDSTNISHEKKCKDILQSLHKSSHKNVENAESNNFKITEDVYSDDDQPDLPVEESHAATGSCVDLSEEATESLSNEDVDAADENSSKKLVDMLFMHLSNVIKKASTASKMDRDGKNPLPGLMLLRSSLAKRKLEGAENEIELLEMKSQPESCFHDEKIVSKPSASMPQESDTYEKDKVTRCYDAKGEEVNIHNPGDKHMLGSSLSDKTVHSRSLSQERQAVRTSISPTPTSSHSLRESQKKHILDEIKKSSESPFKHSKSRSRSPISRGTSSSESDNCENIMHSSPHQCVKFSRRKKIVSNYRRRIESGSSESLISSSPGVNLKSPSPRIPPKILKKCGTAPKMLGECIALGVDASSKRAAEDVNLTVNPSKYSSEVLSTGKNDSQCSDQEKLLQSTVDNSMTSCNKIPAKCQVEKLDSHIVTNNTITVSSDGKVYLADVPLSALSYAREKILSEINKLDEGGSKNVVINEKTVIDPKPLAEGASCDDICNIEDTLDSSKSCNKDIEAAGIIEVEDGEIDSNSEDDIMLKDHKENPKINHMKESSNRRISLDENDDSEVEHTRSVLLKGDSIQIKMKTVCAKPRNHESERSTMSEVLHPGLGSKRGLPEHDAVICISTDSENDYHPYSDGFRKKIPPGNNRRSHLSSLTSPTCKLYENPSENIIRKTVSQTVMVPRMARGMRNSASEEKEIVRSDYILSMGSAVKNNPEYNTGMKICSKKPFIAISPYKTPYTIKQEIDNSYEQRNAAIDDVCQSSHREQTSKIVFQKSTHSPRIKTDQVKDMHGQEVVKLPENRKLSESEKHNVAASNINKNNEKVYKDLCENPLQDINRDIDRDHQLSECAKKSKQPLIKKSKTKASKGNKIKAAKRKKTGGKHFASERDSNKADSDEDASRSLSPHPVKTKRRHIDNKCNERTSSNDTERRRHRSSSTSYSRGRSSSSDSKSSRTSQYTEDRRSLYKRRSSRISRSRRSSSSSSYHKRRSHSRSVSLSSCSKRRRYSPLEHGGYSRYGRSASSSRSRDSSSSCDQRKTSSDQHRPSLSDWHRLSSCDQPRYSSISSRDRNRDSSSDHHRHGSLSSRDGHQHSSSDYDKQASDKRYKSLSDHHRPSSGDQNRSPSRHRNRHPSRGRSRPPSTDRNRSFFSDRNRSSSNDKNRPSSSDQNRSPSGDRNRHSSNDWRRRLSKSPERFERNDSYLSSKLSRSPQKNSCSILDYYSAKIKSDRIWPSLKPHAQHPIDLFYSVANMNTQNHSSVVGSYSCTKNLTSATRSFSDVSGQKLVDPAESFININTHHLRASDNITNICTEEVANASDMRCGSPSAVESVTDNSALNDIAVQKPTLVGENILCTTSSFHGDNGTVGTTRSAGTKEDFVKTPSQKSSPLTENVAEMTSFIPIITTNNTVKMITQKPTGTTEDLTEMGITKSLVGSVIISSTNSLIPIITTDSTTDTITQKPIGFTEDLTTICSGNSVVATEDITNTTSLVPIITIGNNTMSAEASENITNTSLVPVITTENNTMSADATEDITNTSLVPVITSENNNVSADTTEDITNTTSLKPVITTENNTISADATDDITNTASLIPIVTTETNIMPADATEVITSTTSMIPLVAIENNTMLTDATEETTNTTSLFTTQNNASISNQKPAYATENISMTSQLHIVMSKDDASKTIQKSTDHLEKDVSNDTENLNTATVASQMPTILAEVVSSTSIRKHPNDIEMTTNIDTTMLARAEDVSNMASENSHTSTTILAVKPQCSADSVTSKNASCVTGNVTNAGVQKPLVAKKPPCVTKSATDVTIQTPSCSAKSVTISAIQKSSPSATKVVINVPVQNLPGAAKSVTNIAVQKSSINAAESVTNTAVQKSSVNATKNITNIAVQKSSTDATKSVTNTAIQKTLTNATKSVTNIAVQKTSTNATKSVTNTAAQKSSINAAKSVTNTAVQKSSVNATKSVTNIAVQKSSTDGTKSVTNTAIQKTFTNATKSVTNIAVQKTSTNATKVVTSVPLQKLPHVTPSVANTTVLKPSHNGSVTDVTAQKTPDAVGTVKTIPRNSSSIQNLTANKSTSGTVIAATTKNSSRETGSANTNAKACAANTSKSTYKSKNEDSKETGEKFQNRIKRSAAREWSHMASGRHDKVETACRNPFPREVSNDFTDLLSLHHHTQSSSLRDRHSTSNRVYVKDFIISQLGISFSHEMQQSLPYSLNFDLNSSRFSEEEKNIKAKEIIKCCLRHLNIPDDLVSNISIKPALNTFGNPSLENRLEYYTDHQILLEVNVIKQCQCILERHFNETYYYSSSRSSYYEQEYSEAIEQGVLSGDPIPEDLLVPTYGFTFHVPATSLSADEAYEHKLCFEVALERLLGLFKCYDFGREHFRVPELLLLEEEKNELYSRGNCFLILNNSLPKRVFVQLLTLRNRIESLKSKNKEERYCMTRQLIGERLSKLMSRIGNITNKRVNQMRTLREQLQKCQKYVTSVVGGNGIDKLPVLASYIAAVEHHFHMLSNENRYPSFPEYDE